MKKNLFRLFCCASTAVMFVACSKENVNQEKLVLKTTSSSDAARIPIPPGLKVDFSYNTSLIPTGGAIVNFQDESSIGMSCTDVYSISAYSWNFGDGSPLSNAANPSHLYTRSGSYTITLEVTFTNEVGRSIIIKSSKNMVL